MVSDERTKAALPHGLPQQHRYLARTPFLPPPRRRHLFIKTVHLWAASRRCSSKARSNGKKANEREREKRDRHPEERARKGMASLSFPSFHISTRLSPSSAFLPPLSLRFLLFHGLVPLFPVARHRGSSAPSRTARRALINAPANNVFSPGEKTHPRHLPPRHGGPCGLMRN